MMRVIGFLSGVCLSVAAVLLVLGNRESSPQQSVAQSPTAPTAKELSVRSPSPATADEPSAATPSPATADEPAVEAPSPQTPKDLSGQDPPPPTAEELSKVVAAIAEHVDVTLQANESEQALAPQLQAATADGDTQHGIDVSAPAPAEQPEVPAPMQAAAPDRGEHLESGTFLFWSPFRSEGAAEGFARRLSAATQVPVEVVAGGPDGYRVAFSYQDALQRQARIDRIETITGLQLE